MGGAVPKQFQLLGDEPVLLHTLRRCAAALPEAHLTVVLPAAQHAYWQQLLDPHAAVPAHALVAGGASRAESVRNGLAALPADEGEALVVIHDGVRPFVPMAVLREAVAVARARGSAVAAVPLKDSVRRVRPDGSSGAEDRAAFQLVQTPQCFPLATLRHAYATADLTDPTLTDDASIVERAGGSVVLIPGAYENLKLTTPEDLQWATAVVLNMGYGWPKKSKS